MTLIKLEIFRLSRFPIGHEKGNSGFALMKRLYNSACRGRNGNLCQSVLSIGLEVFWNCKLFVLKCGFFFFKLRQKCMFLVQFLESETSFSNFTTKQNNEIRQKSRVLLVDWKQKFEYVIG